MKGNKMAKRSSFGSIMRRRLSDITNSLPQPKSPLVHEKLQPDAASSVKECIDNLVKEKMALVKLIQDKNKIIEMSGIEIQNLRTSLQKMQLQNWNLAQSNSHMLAELTLGKERLKTLQHEIVCKEALLKTKNLQIKGKEEVNANKTQIQEPEMVARESGTNEDTKLSRRRRHSRSRSLGSSMVYHTNTEKETVVSKRRCMRRQSAGCRSSPDEETTGDLFEIYDAKFLVESEHEAGRTCIGRPLRKAAEKVQSYKERPINVKMRRE